MKRWQRTLGWLVLLASLLAASVATAAAAAAPAGGQSGATAKDTEASLAGYWYTVANGDTVRALLREGGLLWSATDGGGVVRWDLASGAYRQWLAPQDGLPANDVRALLRDRAGVLWAGTSAGLARLDQPSGRWLGVALDPGLVPSPSVTAMAMGADGSLWLGLEQSWDASAPSPAPDADKTGAFVGGGVARFDPETGRVGPVVRAAEGAIGEERVAGLPSDDVTSLTFGSDGLLWVGTRPYYQWREDACGRPACPPEDAAWVAVGGGLAATDDLDAGWRHWSAASSPGCLASTSWVTSLAADGGGRMWVGTRGRGLQAYLGGLGVKSCDAASGHRLYERAKDGLPGNHVLSLAVAADGKVWAGVSDGEHGLGVAVLDTRGTYEDPAGVSDDVWTVTGLDGWSGPLDAVVSAIDLGAGPAAFGTRDDRSGDGWGIRLADGVDGVDGVDGLDGVDGASAADATGDTWRALCTADTGLPSNQITAVAAEPGTGRTWLGTLSQGVAVWDGSAFVRHPAFLDSGPLGALAAGAVRGASSITVTLSVEAVRAALAAPPSMVRLGHDRAVYEVAAPTGSAGSATLTLRPPLGHGFPAGTPVHALAPGTAGDAVTSIAFDLAGRAWVGSQKTLVRPAPPGSADRACETFPDCWYDGGLSVYDGGRWTIHRPPAADDGSPIRDVLSLAVDASSRVWAGTGDPGADDGDGVLVRSGSAWQELGRESEGPSFGGDVVTGIAMDPLTGDVWLATHFGRCQGGSVTDPCPTNGRIGGGVSRFDGSGWVRWTKSAGSALAASGTDGNFTTVAFDARHGQVWAGAWSEGAASAHWLSGTGIDAALSYCPRNCSDGAWSSRRFVDDGAVRALAFDSDGRLWVGASRDALGQIPHPGGLHVLDGAAWRYQSTDLWSNEVTALASEGDGMWLGTFDGGAARWRPVVLAPGAYLPAAARRSGPRGR